MDPLTIFKTRLLLLQRLHQQQCPHQVSPLQLREWLSQNPALTLEMVLYDIKTNPTYKHAWTFKHLAKIIPVEHLVEHNILPEPDDLHSPDILRMKITLETLLKTHRTAHHLDYHWGYLTRHRTITLEDMQAHPELPWDYTYLMYHPDFQCQHLDIELFRPHLNEHVFRMLSYRSTYEEIMQHPQEKWFFPGVLASKRIRKEHLPTLLAHFKQEQYLEENITPYHLFCATCCNPNLSLEDLIDLFGEEMCLTYYYQTIYSLGDFQKYPLATWKHHGLRLPLFCNILPLSFIKEHLDEPWDWAAILLRNKTLTYDQFNEIPKNIFPDQSIDMNAWHIRHFLFDNRYLSSFDKRCILEDLLNTQIPEETYPLHRGHIVVSPLFLEPIFQEQEIKEYFAKKKIVRHLVEALSNPAYQQCRKRLVRECTALGIPFLVPKHRL
jgi:hypothetical protein